CPRGCVLVSRSPPKDVVDVDLGGRSLGRIAAQDAVLRAETLLVVCGRIHASAGRHALLGRRRSSTPGLKGSSGAMMLAAGLQQRDLEAEFLAAPHEVLRAGAGLNQQVTRRRPGLQIALQPGVLPDRIENLRRRRLHQGAAPANANPPTG